MLKNALHLLLSISTTPGITGLIVSIVLPCSEGHVVGIIHYLASSDWFLLVGNWMDSFNGVNVQILFYINSLLISG